MIISSFACNNNQEGGGPEGMHQGPPGFHDNTPPAGGADDNRPLKERLDKEAYATGKTPIIKKALENNDPAVLEYQDNQGNNALHLLTEDYKPDTDAIKNILKKNPMLATAKNNAGKTPIELLAKDVNQLNSKNLKPLIENGALDDDPKFGYDKKQNLLQYLASGMLGPPKDFDEILLLVLPKKPDYLDEKIIKTIVGDGILNKTILTRETYDTLAAIKPPLPKFGDIIKELGSVVSQKYKHFPKVEPEIIAKLPADQQALAQTMQKLSKGAKLSEKEILELSFNKEIDKRIKKVSETIRNIERELEEEKDKIKDEKKAAELEKTAAPLLEKLSKIKWNQLKNEELSQYLKYLIEKIAANELGKDGFKPILKDALTAYFARLENYIDSDKELDFRIGESTWSSGKLSILLYGLKNIPDYLSKSYLSHSDDIKNYVTIGTYRKDGQPLIGILKQMALSFPQRIVFQDKKMTALMRLAAIDSAEAENAISELLKSGVDFGLDKPELDPRNYAASPRMKDIINGYFKK